MRARKLAATAAVLFLAAVLLAKGAGEAESKSGSKAAASRLVAIPSGDLKWAELDPKGAPGVEIADVWGDHAKGAFGAFLKFPPGFAAPLHTHTSDYKIVIVSGTLLQAPEGKTEFRLGPGSYLLQPGGNYRHATSCDKASECVFFVQSGGKFDLKPVSVPPASEAAPKPGREVSTPVPASPSPPAPPRLEGSASGVVDPGGPVAVPATKSGLTRIGAQKCKICHQVPFASWIESSHARRNPPLDCESCHGPGSEYKSLAVMKDPVKARAAGLVIPTAAFCTKCHVRGWKDDMLRKAHAHQATANSG